MSKHTSGKNRDDADPALLQQALHQLLEQISKRDQKITERDTLLHYTRVQLKEKETQLDEILSNRAWKVVLFLQRIRIFLVSPNQRRVQMLRRGWDIIQSSFQRSERN